MNLDIRSFLIHVVGLPASVWILAAVLSLPLMISWLLRPAAGVTFDPWRVRRLRRTLIWSVPLYTGLHLAYNAHRLSLLGESAFTAGWLAMGPVIFIAWQPWLLLVLLARDLRRGRRDPLPGISRRSASLVPRGSKAVVSRRHWAMVWTIWVAGGLALAADGLAACEAGSSLTSWILFATGGVFLIAGPAILRTALETEAEPLATESSMRDRWLPSYENNRRANAWMSFRIIGGCVLVNLVLAFATAGDHPKPTHLLTVTILGAGWMVLETSVYTYRRHRIAALKARS